MGSAQFLPVCLSRFQRYFRGGHVQKSVSVNLSGCEFSLELLLTISSYHDDISCWVPIRMRNFSSIEATMVGGVPTRLYNVCDIIAAKRLSLLNRNLSVLSAFVPFLRQPQLFPTFTLVISVVPVSPQFWARGVMDSTSIWVLIRVISAILNLRLRQCDAASTEKVPVVDSQLYLFALYSRSPQRNPIQDGNYQFGCW